MLGGYREEARVAHMCLGKCFKLDLELQGLKRNSTE